MNASIDFWLDELDTQQLQLSPEQLHALRAPSSGSVRETAAAVRPAARVERAAVDAAEWPAFAAPAATALA
jgi:hypothetical protein